jgi:hypothetical protein
VTTLRARLAKVCAHLAGSLFGCPSPTAARLYLLRRLRERETLLALSTAVLLFALAAVLCVVTRDRTPGQVHWQKIYNQAMEGH